MGDFANMNKKSYGALEHVLKPIVGLGKVEMEGNMPQGEDPHVII